MSKSKPIRKLTKAETAFVKKAESLHFTVEYTDERGDPFATGASKNGACLRMDVTEIPIDKYSSHYTLND